MILSTKKLNKFVDLSKKLVNFKDYSIEEQEEFVSNAIAIYRNNNLGSSAITAQVAIFFLFLVDPRREVGE
ncbi:DNA-binding protein [Limosilactobacillus reuteri]|uniref:DNA-binding protein n=1 Tax=Limosilactobacillus reuteri TaxID=1598 RepID=UPI001F4D8A59|nr:DNA-binding protein [Limosilactobacillus reuteri]MCH9393566.1 DNA-binding protein [Limosilactobacillus reuteri]